MVSADTETQVASRRVLKLADRKQPNARALQELDTYRQQERTLQALQAERDALLTQAAIKAGVSSKMSTGGAAAVHLGRIRLPASVAASQAAAPVQRVAVNQSDFRAIHSVFAL